MGSGSSFLFTVKVAAWATLAASSTHEAKIATNNAAVLKMLESAVTSASRFLASEANASPLCNVTEVAQYAGMAGCIPK